MTHSAKITLIDISPMPAPIERVSGIMLNFPDVPETFIIIRSPYALNKVRCSTPFFEK